VLVGVLGALFGAAVLWDAFETVVLPRRVTRYFRYTRLFFSSTWFSYSRLVSFIGKRKRRESFLSYYGPLSLLILLLTWAMGMILAFALLHWALGSPLRRTDGAMEIGFLMDLYASGTTFTTLGLGDIVPVTGVARLLVVLEAGTGFGFLAIVIGYLPVIYQAFSQRERDITLLDARAGSPPSAVELLRRYAEAGAVVEIDDFLREWEHWSAELMESHISYPVLAYYRSQHDNQSWIAALTTILDTAALLSVGVEGTRTRQAQLTFAIARHAAVDLAQVFRTPPSPPEQERLRVEELGKIREILVSYGIGLRDGEEHDRRLNELRKLYEPYVHALASHLHMNMPDWLPTKTVDNWQTSAWGRASTGFRARRKVAGLEDEHI
jgi:hypothetical protein